MSPVWVSPLGVRVDNPYAAEGPGQVDSSRMDSAVRLGAQPGAGADARGARGWIRPTLGGRRRPATAHSRYPAWPRVATRRARNHPQTLGPKRKRAVPENDPLPSGISRTAAEHARPVRPTEPAAAHCTRWACRSRALACGVRPSGWARAVPRGGRSSRCAPSACAATRIGTAGSLFQAAPGSGGSPRAWRTGSRRW